MGRHIALYETLTAAESRTLRAIAARLIAADAVGPDVSDAAIVRYIDRALGGPLAALRREYAAGLAAVDAYAKDTMGAAFARLSAADQDVVLIDMERDTAPGFTPSAAVFLNLVRAHALEGMCSEIQQEWDATFLGLEEGL